MTTASIRKLCRCVRARLAAAAAPAHPQAGIALVEALVAIVVFSIGVLGIVGMQARSVQMLGDAAYRAQAAQHASELIAEMWTSDPSRRAVLYSTGGVRYAQWAALVEAGSRSLPGAVTNPPVVNVVTTQVAIPSPDPITFTVSDVTVTVLWQAPGAPVSQYVTTARILEPQS